MSFFSEASNWIWLHGEADVNCYLHFRCSFFSASSRPLKLLVSAEGQYAAFLNGEYLPSTQYPDFPSAKSVQTIVANLPADVSEGVLDIQVYYPGVDSHVTRKEVPGLRFEVWQEDRLLCASGTRTMVRPVPGYQNGSVPMITKQLGFGFRYFHPVEQAWKFASIVKKDCRTVPRPVSELILCPEKNARILTQGIFAAHPSGLQQYAALSFREWDSLTDASKKGLPAPNGIHLSCTEGNGIYLIVDLGQETAGYLTLDMLCAKAAKVEIGFGEHLEDLRVRTDVGGRHFTLEWEAPQTRQPFTHRFHRIAGRYLQIFIYAGEVDIYDINLIPVMYPLREDSTFHCADRLHEQIYERSKYTLRNCLHEHYEDCPWREQALYAFDSRNQMLFGYYAFGEFQQPRANLKLLALSQREDGLLEMCAPARIPVNIPSFSLVFILALEEYCRFSGDLSLAQELLEVVHRILETFHNHFRSGRMENFRELQYWNFYEWRPLLDGTPIEKEEPSELSCEAVLQLFYILALQRTQKIHSYLKLGDIPYAADLKQAIDGMEEYWSEKDGAYASFIRNGKKVQYAELTQALALYAGVCPKERRAALRELLASGTLEPVSLSSSVFKYDALLQNGYKYGPQVLDEIASRWGNMLFNGATTVWETDLGAEDFDRAGSLCHAWSSIPVYIYGAYVLGVRPEEPGAWVQQRPIPSSVLRARGTLYPPGGSLDIVTFDL